MKSTRLIIFITIILTLAGIAVLTGKKVFSHRERQNADLYQTSKIIAEDDHTTNTVSTAKDDYEMESGNINLIEESERIKETAKKKHTFNDLKKMASRLSDQDIRAHLKITHIYLKKSGLIEKANANSLSGDEAEVLRSVILQQNALNAQLMERLEKKL